MAYLKATRYGLTRVEPTEDLRASGWRQVWEHPSGALAMRHPVSGHWVICRDGEIGREIGPGFASSLRAVARMIDRQEGGLTDG